jgi:hypothetical protein
LEELEWLMRVTFAETKNNVRMRKYYGNKTNIATPVRECFRTLLWQSEGSAKDWDEEPVEEDGRRGKDGVWERRGGGATVAERLQSSGGVGRRP